MSEHRLIERIRCFGQKPGRRANQNPGQVVQSIKEHLQRILNTHVGSVPIADDYGVPDFINLRNTFPDSQWEIERNLRRTIQKYEPRLNGVRVSLLPGECDPFTLCLRITAHLALVDCNESVTFESEVDASGHVEMKKYK